MNTWGIVYIAVALVSWSLVTRYIARHDKCEDRGAVVYACLIGLCLAIIWLPMLGFGLLIGLLYAIGKLFTVALHKDQEESDRG